jgi:hypothetical protein
VRATALLCTAVLAAIAACGAPVRDRLPPPVDLAPLVPAIGSLPGWSIAEGPDEYLPETLFEVLDGGAPVYHALGFRRLVRIRYQLGGESLACVTLDLFDLGTPLGAFGIYRAALPATAAPRSWGAEGYRGGTIAAAWKGAVYVHAEADADRPPLADALERIVALSCGAIPGSTALPAILAPLPRERLVARSERYVARDLLGHDFLPGGVVATYRAGGRDAELFFSELAGAAAARAAAGRLRTHLASSGAVEPLQPPIGSDGFRFTDRVSGAGIAVRAGRFVAGVRGDLPAVIHERLLAELVANLESARTSR